MQRSGTATGSAQPSNAASSHRRGAPLCVLKPIQSAPVPSLGLARCPAASATPFQGDAAIGVRRFCAPPAVLGADQRVRGVSSRRHGATAYAHPSRVFQRCRWLIRCTHCSSFLRRIWLDLQRWRMALASGGRARAQAHPRAKGGRLMALGERLLRCGAERRLGERAEERLREASSGAAQNSELVFPSDRRGA